MAKKIIVDYDYIINCSAEVEVDENFDIDDESSYDDIELPDDDIEVKVNGENWDCEFVGVNSVSEAD